MRKTVSTLVTSVPSSSHIQRVKGGLTRDEGKSAEGGKEEK
jgi:hypothetical protein